MHLAEGILPLNQAIAFSAVGAATLAWSMRGEQIARCDEGTPSVLMAGVTSLLFAVTLLPLPVPVVGATSHICLTPVLALIIGIRRIIWPTFFVLLLQALFFAHGGLTTLGINTIALGVVGPMATIGLWTLIKRLGFGGAVGLGLACGVGGLMVYITDAFVLAFALSNVAEPATTFTTVVLGFAPVQVPLAIVESVAAVAIIRLLANRRPDLLPEALSELKRPTFDAAKRTSLLVIFGLFGCRYEGIDGTVFGAAAESAGRAPTNSIIDMSQGEMGLAMSVLILFGLGFIAGRTWERLFHGGKDALPR
ncbi:MAG: energy-coupling factor ABC transporter permease [Myxococcota bacterium]|nr:energy-coupling factor ABC transporter permease [Myxococcota bacterium]